MEAFREYKNFKPGWKPRRRIPIIRGLLVVLLIYAVYASGAVGKVSAFIESQRSSPIAVPDYSDAPWQERCAASGGKSFVLKRGLGQCSWTLASAKEVSSLPENSFVRYTATAPSVTYPIRVHWLSDTTDFWNPKVLGIQDDSAKRWFFRLMLADSSYAWVRPDGCLAPGYCPRNPLQGGALPISVDFDFAGREDLLLKDLFMGIGEAPVYPVLPARVVSVSKDSSGYGLLLDHGGDLFSRVSGLSRLSPGVDAGAVIAENAPLGRLSPSDSAVFFLEVLRNGRFVRWDDFYKASHVALPEDVAAFRSEIGF